MIKIITCKTCKKKFKGDSSFEDECMKCLEKEIDKITKPNESTIQDQEPEKNEPHDLSN
jgi:phage FluMu protein Com